MTTFPVDRSYAEGLDAADPLAGFRDRFVLDGRSLEFRRLDGLTVLARSGGGDPGLPKWSSDHTRGS